MVVSFLYIATCVVSGILLATTGTPPDLTGIAAIITAGVGMIAFLASLFRGKKNNKRVEEVEEAASYVKGFDALIKRLQEEISDLHTDIASERTLWAQEKGELMDTIRVLRNELQTSMAENATTQSQLMELRGQIRGFLSAQQYEEFTKHL